VRDLLPALVLMLVLALSALDSRSAEPGALPQPTEAKELPEGVTPGRPTAEGHALAPDAPDAAAAPDASRAGEPPAARDPATDGLPPVDAALLSGAPPPLGEPVPTAAGDDEAFWRGRRERAQQSLAAARDALRETEDAFTKACRYQGGGTCDALRTRADALRRAEQALERYLESGLREECRRAGCLPGWIREGEGGFTREG
jgi:hypothetical protein